MHSFLLPLLFVQYFYETTGKIPIVINTWDFEEANNQAWNVLSKGRSALEAVEAGCSTCERLQCDGTVGFGGSPDENGETTLDALIFDGTTMDMGAVGALRNVKKAISVAKHVLKYTTHSLLVGKLATDFAVDMGFTSKSLSTNKSLDIWKKWKESDCQPNSWRNVSPDSGKYCGPYKPTSQKRFRYKARGDERNHDTIGMIAIDGQGHVVAGTSTNGMTHKIPGRVGDSPIPGAGAYADSSVGGASATGDGDVMMRFLPSFLAVEEMRKGASPTKAARTAVRRIREKYSTFFGGVVVVDNNGTYGAACNGMEKFTFCVSNADTNGTRRVKIACT